MFKISPALFLHIYMSLSIKSIYTNLSIYVSTVSLSIHLPIYSSYVKYLSVYLFMALSAYLVQCM